MSTLAWTPRVSFTQKRICGSCLVPTDKQYGSVINGLFICDYCSERGLHEETYCNHCGIVPIQKEEKYCVECIDEIVDSLATEYQEGIAVEKGWM